MLKKIQESHAGRLAGFQDQHRVMKQSTFDHFPVDGLQAAYQTPKKLHSEPPSQVSALQTAYGWLPRVIGQGTHWALGGCNNMYWAQIH